MPESPGVLAALAQIGTPAQAPAKTGSLSQVLAWAGYSHTMPTAPPAVTNVNAVGAYTGTLPSTTSTWVQVLAAAPTDLLIGQVTVQTSSSYEPRIQVGVGAAGAEVAIAEFHFVTGTASPGQTMGTSSGALDVAPVVYAGERIAVRGIGNNGFGNFGTNDVIGFDAVPR